MVYVIAAFNSSGSVLFQAFQFSSFPFDAAASLFPIAGRIADGTLPANSTGDEYYDLFGSIPNNAGSGVTGDIDFTTVSASSGDAYSIILVLHKNYS